MALLDDNYFMRQAFQEARAAYDENEVPIGAVIVSENRIIARAHNLTETLNDVTAHAEMQAITAASDMLGSKYLTKCTLYVTVEPCVMCAGALSWAQIGRVVYGASDEKRGFTKYFPDIMLPKTEIKGGVMADDCGDFVSAFFQEKRHNSN